MFVFSFLPQIVTASTQTDENNTSTPAVRVIKKYPGDWRGWSDGCVNCDKPVTAGKARKTRKAKPKKTRKKTMSADTLKEIKHAQSRNYCECSCKSVDENGNYSVEYKLDDAAKKKSGLMQRLESRYQTKAVPAEDSKKEQATKDNMDDQAESHRSKDSDQESDPTSKAKATENDVIDDEQ